MKGIQWIGLMAVLFIACHPNKNSNSNDMKDQEITVIGTARNGKGNALIVTKEKVAYYIDGLDAWETAVEGKEISVTGILTIETLTEENLKNEQSEWKQGVAGDRKIMTKARWLLITK